MRASPVVSFSPFFFCGRVLKYLCCSGLLTSSLFFVYYEKKIADEDFVADESESDVAEEFDENVSDSGGSNASDASDDDGSDNERPAKKSKK